MKTKNLFVLMAAAILIGFCVSQHALAGPCDEPCSYSTVLLDAPGGVGSSEAGPAQTMTDHSSGEGVYWDWPSFEYDGSSNRDLTLSFDFYDLGNWIDNFTSHNWSWGIVEKDPDRKTCYQGSPSRVYPTGAGEQSCFWLHGEDLGGSWEHYEITISSSKLVDGTNTLYLRAAHSVYGMGSRQVKNVKVTDGPLYYEELALDAPGGVGSSEAGPAQAMTDHSSGEGVYFDWPSFEYDASSNQDLTLSYDFYDLGNWIDNFTSHNWSWGIVEKDPDRKTCYQGSPSSLYPTGAGEQSCFWLHGEDLGGSWEHYEVPISSSKLVDGTNTLYLRAAHAVYGMGSRQVKNVKIGRTLSCCEVIGGLQTDLAACQSAGSACVNCADISTEVLDTICTVLGIAAPTSTPEFIASTTALAQAVLANTTVCPDTTGGADCLAHILDQI